MPDSCQCQQCLDDRLRRTLNHAPSQEDIIRASGGARGARGVVTDGFASDRLNRLPEASEARKEIPLTTGLLDYFPDALAAVAFVSKFGNDKHNPGEPLHHARGKSMDHADCIARHLIDRGGHDVAGIRHSAYLAWRALALLQEELEKDQRLSLPRGAWPA